MKLAATLLTALLCVLTTAAPAEQRHGRGGKEHAPEHPTRLG